MSEYFPLRNTILINSTDCLHLVHPSDDCSWLAIIVVIYFFKSNKVCFFQSLKNISFNKFFRVEFRCSFPSCYIYIDSNLYIR